MTTHSHNRAGPRCGSMLTEAMIALALAAVILVSVAQLLGQSARQRQTLRQRQQAMLEAANLMEEIASRPWGDLSGDSPLPELSDTLHSLVPTATLSLDVRDSESTNSELGKRIQVTIDWGAANTALGDPISLVAWQFPKEVVP